MRRLDRFEFRFAVRFETLLQAWLSIGYIVLLAILGLAFILWRRGIPLAIAALVVGIPLFLVWMGIRTSNMDERRVTGTEVCAAIPTLNKAIRTDINTLHARTSDRGMELTNEDSWWWFKRNSERVFNDAKTAQDRDTE